MVDLNKPITVPWGKSSEGSSAPASLKAKLFDRSSKGGDAYPSKTTINLMECGVDSQGNTLHTVIAFVIGLILIGIFCKACVVNPLASSAAVDKQVADAQAELGRLKAENSENASVSGEYGKYVVKDMTAEESALVQRSIVFDLIEERFDGVGYISSVALSGNNLTITLLGADMSSVSNAVAQLEDDSRVGHVTVSTAQGQDTTARSATITVILNDAQVVSSQGDSASSSQGASNTSSQSASNQSASNASNATSQASSSSSEAFSSSSSKGGN